LVLVPERAQVQAQALVLKRALGLALQVPEQGPGRA
jgi:hypothetical protein